MSSYNYTKYTRLDQLEDEIRSSSIVTALDYIEGTATDTTIYFKAALSTADNTTLDTIVTDHTPQAVLDTPQPVSVQEQAPFAKPDYRTKRDATANWTSCAENTSTNIDFQLTSEKYVTGGEIIFKNAKEGDYIVAEVHDVGAVIPDDGTREAVCEAWPTVAKYVVKKWVIPTEVDKYGSFMIDTHPLNAKISAGLYLRVTYVASAETGTRKCAVNYHLTKKL